MLRNAYFLFLIVLTVTMTFSFKSHSKLNEKKKAGQLVLRDHAVYTVGNKTYFLNELNEILLLLKNAKCFQSNYLLQYLSINNLDKLEKLKPLMITKLNSKSSIYKFKILSSFVKLEHFAKGKNIYQSFNNYYKKRKCFYQYNKKIERIIHLEMYLSDRLKSLGNDSVQSFKETMISLINIKTYEL